MGIAPSGQAFKGLGAAVAKEADTAPEQHGVSGDQKGWSAGNRLRVAYLCLAHTQEGFLISKVDLDLPARQIAAMSSAAGVVRSVVIKKAGSR